MTSFHLFDVTYEFLCLFRKLRMPKFYFRGMTHFQDVIRHAYFCMMGIESHINMGKYVRILTNYI